MARVVYGSVPLFDVVEDLARDTAMGGVDQLLLAERDLERVDGCGLLFGRTGGTLRLRHVRCSYRFVAPLPPFLIDEKRPGC